MYMLGYFWPSSFSFGVFGRRVVRSRRLTIVTMYTISFIKLKFMNEMAHIVILVSLLELTSGVT